MASTGKCPFCGAVITSDQKNCPDCGAENPNYSEDHPRQILKPKTLSELKEYCAERGMPLLRMRFFIGVNNHESRAFGIYQEGSRFIVYKNKSDGSRAVRYDGPDEAYAVNEIYTKLIEECHSRGIYPDRPGPPAPAQSHTGTVTNSEDREEIEKRRAAQREAYYQIQKYKEHEFRMKVVILFCLLAVIIVVLIVAPRQKSASSGYGASYPSTRNSYSTYYDNNRHSNSRDNDRHSNSRDSDWGSDWGSNDYDSWDSGGSDWDSDW